MRAKIFRAVIFTICCYLIIFVGCSLARAQNRRGLSLFEFADWIKFGLVF